MTAAARVRVEGTVQGVGFRPYVYRLASELALGGHVLNDERGVLVEVEGEPAAVARFVERLPAEAPPLARVELSTEAPGSDEDLAKIDALIGEAGAKADSAARAMGVDQKAKEKADEPPPPEGA